VTTRQKKKKKKKKPEEHESFHWAEAASINGCMP
jgi:hypothetical protein